MYNCVPRILHGRVDLCDQIQRLKLTGPDTKAEVERPTLPTVSDVKAEVEGPDAKAEVGKSQMTIVQAEKPQKRGSC